MASDSSLYRKNLRLVIKWTLYTLVLVLSYIIGQDPHLFSLWGVRPVLIVPVAVCVAMFEHEFSGGVFAVVAGILWGCSSDAVFGYYAILLLVLGVAAGLICSYGLSPNLLTALLLAGGSSLILGLLDFFFFYVLWSYNGLMPFFLTRMLPTIALTALAVIPYYFIIRLIHARLRPPK
ncbi:MAG: hypothetical protein ACERKO_03485 [Acetanaerobacterium sp.]